MAIRLTESRLRQIIREEASNLTRSNRRNRRLNEGLDLAAQIDDAIAMSAPPEPALRRYRRQLGDGLDDMQLAKGLFLLITRNGNVGPELEALGDRIMAGDEQAVYEFCDAARQSVELAE
jgi:hypothetical protein